MRFHHFLLSLLAFCFFSACRARIDPEATLAINVGGDSLILEKVMANLPVQIDDIKIKSHTAVLKYREDPDEDVDFSYDSFGTDDDENEWKVESGSKDFTFRENGEVALFRHQKLTKGFTIVYRIQK